jgi:AraC family transcriptional activator of mtrCDE
VADAAEMAGYQSESAFTRMFKKETGLSPAALRRHGAQNAFSMIANADLAKG